MDSEWGERRYHVFALGGWDMSMISNNIDFDALLFFVLCQI